MIEIIKESTIERNDRHRFARATSFLLALNVMAFYYYGVRALIISVISVTVSFLTDYICCCLTKKKFDITDTSPIMSGMILALLMPASVPYRVIIFASAFMSSVGKFAFGGNNNLIFSPAALAYVFAALSWPNDILRYPKPVPFGSLSLASDVPDLLDRSFTYYADISLSSASYLDIVWGKITGPMGTTGILIILICAVSLYFFKDIPSPVFFSAVATETILFVVFPFAATGWTAAAYSMITGSYLFVLIFMACDYRFVPKRIFAQILYGFFFALMAFVMRKYTSVENSGVFALLIVCIFVSELDRLDLFLANVLGRLFRYLRRKLSQYFIYLKFKKDNAKQANENTDTASEVEKQETEETDNQKPDIS